VAKLTKEHRQNLSDARSKEWARLSPEEKKKRIDMSKRYQQLHKIKTGSLLRPYSTPAFVDPDFDEGL
jgi:hypothetical protein